MDERLNVSRLIFCARVATVLAVVVLGFGLPGIAVPAWAQTSTTAPSAPTAPADQSLTWSVRPVADGTDRANFEYVVAPGATLTDVLQVTNRGDVPLELNVYARDAFTTPTGGIDLLPAGESSVDGGSWITVSTPQIIVAPGQVVDVPFTVAVPATAEPGDHPAGIVTSLVSDGQTRDGAPVAIDRRLGSRVYIRVDGPLNPVFELETTELRYNANRNPFAPGSIDITYTVTNTGNVRLRASQRIQTSGPFGVLKQSVAPEDTPEILPGFSLTFTERVPDVWPTVRVTTQLAVAPYSQSRGPISPAPAAVLVSTPVVALPWPQLITLGVVFLVLGATWWRRRRRRRQMRATVDQAVAKALAAAGVTPNPVSVGGSPPPTESVVDLRTEDGSDPSAVRDVPEA